MVLSTVPTVGKYTLGERIERPGPGESSLAYHRQRYVVVRLLADLPPDRLPAFEALAARLVDLDHPHIAPVLAYGEEAGAPYLVTPLVAGERLAASFARGQLRTGELAAIVRQLAEAIDHAHGGDAFHGSLSAMSVLVDGDGEVVIDDFGVAALYGEREATPGADIAALARLADEGLAGTATADAEAMLGTQEVLRRGLASAHGNGYRSAGEFAAAFAIALADAAPIVVKARPQREKVHLPHPAQPFLPKSPRARRITAIWAAALALAVVFVLGGYIALFNLGTANTATPPKEQPIVAALPPSGDLPFYFPATNELIAAKYAEAQAKLPPEAADARLHHFAAECANPLVEETCLLVYVFYGKQADGMFNYHFSIDEDRLIGEFVEPAENDDFRVVMETLPWERNPNWAQLIKESHAQLPNNLRFAARLSSRAAAANSGVDWTIVYVDRADEKTQHIFTLSGNKVTKLP